MSKSFLYRRRGFTLIELLIVVAVLGVISTFAIIRLTGPQASARDGRRKAELKQYQTAIEVYANRNNGLYPIRTSATAVTSMCGSSVLNITTCADDPKSSQGWLQYMYQSDNGGFQYVMWTQLEKVNSSGNTQYYVVCSSGGSGFVDNSMSGSGGACPALRTQ